mmetsp:Transcript_73161/g.148558  ORF Transcript_73161/g.148558 Transcript_73161/m.148558 type:complete len:226 (-) Transcript_73161:1461-2138(-)
MIEKRLVSASNRCIDPFQKYENDGKLNKKRSQTHLIENHDDKELTMQGKNVSENIFLDSGTKETTKNEVKQSTGSSKDLILVCDAIPSSEDQNGTEDVNRTEYCLITQAEEDESMQSIESSDNTLGADDHQPEHILCNEIVEHRRRVHSLKDDSEKEKSEDRREEQRDDDTDRISSEDLEYMYGTLPMDKLPSTPRTSNRNITTKEEFRKSPRSRSKLLIPFGRG